ncbi:uncharacterized protein LOC135169166 [Diachasmimorpha longicaudata]|uniref:uncharacterized protein LOC135169166 n=1 Tax=Diachasmimorpha longicaudata TaxID=58733 RepID=UPI0030B895FA
MSWISFSCATEPGMSRHTRSHGTMSRLRQILNREFDQLCDHDYNREIQIPRFLLSSVGVWPEPGGSNTIKFIISMTAVTLFSFLSRFIALFFIVNDNKYFYYIGSTAYRFYVIVLMLLLRFSPKAPQSILTAMYGNLKSSRSTEDREVMRYYAAYSRKLSIIIFAAFVGIFVITWLNIIIATTVGSENLRARADVMNYPFLPSSQIFDALSIIVFMAATAISCAPTAGIEIFYAVCISHTCGQLVILRNRVAAYEGVIRHQFGDDIPRMCSCLKCIVDSHVAIGDFVGRINSHFNVVMLMRLIAGGIVMICSGFEVSKAIVKSSYADFMMFFIFSFIPFLTVFINCSLADMCQQASYAVGDAAYSTDWMTKHPSHRRNLMLIINYARMPLKFTTGNYFVVCRGHFKDVSSLIN